MKKNKMLGWVGVRVKVDPCNYVRVNPTDAIL